MLPTTIETNGKTIILHPKAYPDLNWSESTFLARLAVLTKNGSQPCVYTDRQAAQEFRVTEMTITRMIRKLKAQGYITTAKVSDLNFGANVRQITLDPAKLGAPEPEATPPAPAVQVTPPLVRSRRRL